MLDAGYGMLFMIFIFPICMIIFVLIGRKIKKKKGTFGEPIAMPACLGRTLNTVTLFARKFTIIRFLITTIKLVWQAFSKTRVFWLIFGKRH